MAKGTIESLIAYKKSAHPAPEWVQRLDYTKGDDARSVEEYAREVSPDFKVISNKRAKDPAIFAQGPIMVYGENHNNPNLFSVRGEGEGVLLESGYKEYCNLVKYQGRLCKHIDTGRDKKFNRAIIENAQTSLDKGIKILNLISPQVSKSIQKNMNSPDDTKRSIPRLMAIIDKELANKALKVFSEATSPQMQKQLAESIKSYSDAQKKYTDLVTSSASYRESIMAEESSKAIKKMKSGESATVIVGDAHAPRIARELAKNFPEKALVFTKSPPNNVH
jgi:hypothetical protein